MFLKIKTSQVNMIVNLQSIVKIEARHKDGNPDNSEWEVAVFYQNKRKLNPKNNELIWVSTYEVILTDSKEKCEDLVVKIESAIRDLKSEPIGIVD